ncbi:MAG: glucose-1-phosphate cytidylyltransferase [Fibromonadaceae bacterium]|jgi:glucose-1-phosphate cytidylyltransferase|nr:glucose-1-phosphate cytidylyltransferase [Fibromonadaceae bacterium]
MKVVILAGGYGTRISEESYLKPKPMIELGGQPILWHIMKSYSHYGYNEFIICCGYKANVIKEYFANYYLYRSDMTFDFANNGYMTIHNNIAEPWRVTIVDTGLDTLTGGRVKRVAKYLKNETFMLTYGDGVCDVNINELVKYHHKHGKLATITAVRPSSRFGNLTINEKNMVSNFAEKRQENSGYINGGFMVLEPNFLDHISGDETILEHEPLEYAANSNNLIAYIHNGFWSCMDTMRDKQHLESLLATGKAPWEVWKND